MIAKLRLIRKVESESKRYDIQTANRNFYANGILVHNSLIIAYPNRGRICVATRGMIFAHGPVGAVYDKNTKVEMTFADLFWQTVAENLPAQMHSPTSKAWTEHFCYLFELTSPENRVVTPYFKRQIHLLAARRTNTWEELSNEELEILARNIGATRPKTYSFTSVDHVNSLLASLETLDEGFVVVDYSQKVNGSFARIKVKNPKYLAAAHLLGSHFSPKGVLEVILKDGKDEFLSYFPEYKDTFVRVETAFETLAFEVDKAYATIKHLCPDPKDKAQKKAFAAEAVKTPFAGMLFHIVDGHSKDGKDALKSTAKFKLENLYELMLKTTLKG